MGLTVTGAAGRLFWGYHPAGTLRAWTVAKVDDHWTLTATVDQIDAVRVSQRPLTFVTPNAWRWPVLELQIAGASLHARLGQKESRHVPHATP
jgi:hypothetical protein